MNVPEHRRLDHGTPTQTLGAITQNQAGSLFKANANVLDEFVRVKRATIYT
jgi:hypothetical protein